MSELKQTLQAVNKEDLRGPVEDYDTIEVQAETTALEYYLIPSLSLLIPKCKQSHNALLSALNEHHNTLALPTELHEYPLISAHHAQVHFSTYTIWAVMRKVYKSKQRQSFSGWTQGARDAHRRAVADQEREANKQKRAEQRKRRTSDLGDLF